MQPDLTYSLGIFKTIFCISKDLCCSQWKMRWNKNYWKSR